MAKDDTKSLAAAIHELAMVGRLSEDSQKYLNATLFGEEESESNSEITTVQTSQTRKR